jgi:hypothetical protein
MPNRFALGASAFVPVRGTADFPNNCFEQPPFRHRVLIWPGTGSARALVTSERTKQLKMRE